MASIELDRAQAAEVELMLNGIRNGAARAINAALNKAAEQSQTKAVKHIYDELALTKPAIKAQTKVTKSDFTKLQSKLEVSGKPLYIVDDSISTHKRIGEHFYKASLLKLGKGVSVTVRKSKGVERLHWAFKATMKSGHTMLFQRDLRDPKRVAKANVWGSSVLPIEQLLGPGVASVFEHHGYTETHNEGGELVQRLLDHEVDRILDRFG